MVRNPKLSKHIHDAGWGMFKQMLIQKVQGMMGVSFIWLIRITPVPNCVTVVGRNLSLESS